MTLSYKYVFVPRERRKKGCSKTDDKNHMRNKDIEKTVYVYIYKIK